MVSLKTAVNLMIGVPVVLALIVIELPILFSSDAWMLIPVNIVASMGGYLVMKTWGLKK